MVCGAIYGISQRYFPDSTPTLRKPDLGLDSHLRCDRVHLVRRKAAAKTTWTIEGPVARLGRCSSSHHTGPSTMRGYAMRVKVCRRCGKEKPLEAYASSKGAPRVVCCWCDPSGESPRRTNRFGRPPKRKPPKQLTREQRRRSLDQYLRKQYGITLADRDQMEATQSGMCAVCGGFGELVVDHDHATGEVRALVHHRCNSLLGFVEGVMSHEGLELEEVLDSVRQYLRGTCLVDTRAS